jgi:putative ABC transport system permease protein
MVQNYLLLFVRNLLRQRLFSAINLLGLTASIASTILIYLYVSHEFSYDRFHEHADRLYRVNQTFIWGDNNDNQFSRTGPGVAHAIKDELPEVEAVTSLHTPGNFLVSYSRPNGEVLLFEETKVLAADTNFFRVLSFPLLKGDEKTAFRDANTLMVTQSTAKKYFGNDEAIGKFLRVGIPNSPKTQDYQVTGVIEDVPANSTIQFDMLLTSKNFDVDQRHWSWIWTQLETFALFRENADMNDVQTRLAAIPEKRAEETLQRVMNISYKEYTASGKTWQLFLQPMSKLHLPENMVISSFADMGNIKVIYSLIAAGIFIVLLSCVNFMNLTTAQFSRRVKEAGVRKILGLGKTELKLGFFVEAFMFSILALVAAIAIIQIFLPTFSLLIGKQIDFNLTGRPDLILVLAALVFTMAFVSSLYPAYFLNGFNLVEAVKGKIRPGKASSSFRNMLVVVQFTVSIVLIISTAIVFQQLQYVSAKDLGFDKENLLRIKHVEGVANAATLVKAVKEIPGVVDVSLSTSTPPEIYGGDKFTADGMNGEVFSLNFTMADEHYLPTFGIKLLAGRNFSPESDADTDGVIVNQATLKKLGIADYESAIGKRLYYGEGVFTIIGVSNDFNYWSLAVDIEPLAIFHINSKNIFDTARNFITVKVKAGSLDDWERVSADLQKTWKQHAGAIPFEFGFIDEYFGETFKTQQRFSYALATIATLAVMIACLGLLGMIIYALEQRTKEIGIRKVSGASSFNILSLIASSYLKLIVVAFAIGAPVSYYLMEGWLNDFSFRITPSPWIFVLTGLAICIVATAIAGYHSLRAARRNPVDVLRDE